jgi:hypothetical protein
MQSTDVLNISLVFFFILTFTRSSFVMLNGEGYQNVVIQIHPDVPYDTDFLRKLQVFVTANICLS